MELNFQYVPCVEQEIAWKTAKEFLYRTEDALNLSRIVLREADPDLYRSVYGVLRYKTREPSQEDLEQVLQDVPAHVNLKHALLIHQEREAAGLLFLHSALLAQAEKDYIQGGGRMLPQHDISTLERIWRDDVRYCDNGLEHMTQSNKNLFHHLTLLRDYFCAPRFQVGAVLGYGMLLELAKDPPKIEKEKKKEN